MLRKLKAALVESYVGAIGLGWVFANAISHFIGAVAAPVTFLVTRRAVLTKETNLPPWWTMRDFLPELFRASLYLVLGYLLLRWLYYPRARRRSSGKTAQR